MSDVPALTLDTASPERIALSGDLVFGNAADALARLRAALRGRAGAVLDLSGVNRADSAGLALLLALAADAAARKQTLRCDAVPESLIALAQLSDVSELLGFAEAGPESTATR